jgi:hypothetical protein
VLDVERWAELRREHFVRGVSIKELARRFGVDRNPVRRALRADEPPVYRRAPAGSKLDAFKPEIHRLLADDAALTGQRIRELIAPLGFDGGKTIVDDYSELDKLQRIPLLVVDEVGYIPFDPQAANLMFMLVSRRYERASVIVTSNKPFSAWGEIFGDDVVAAAMIDRLVHHAEVISMKGDSYRLKDRDLGRVPPATKTND